MRKSSPASNTEHTGSEDATAAPAAPRHPASGIRYPALASASLPSAASMAFRRRLQPLYFRLLPWPNYVFNRWRRGRWDRRYMPRELMIEVTNHCNAKCMMCPHEHMRRPRGHMDMAIFESIVDECRAFEGRGLCLTLHKDGEPLMDPHLFPRIRHIRNRLPRSWVQFNTNAALLNEAKAKQLLEDPPDRIVFSVDGASAETYAPIRVGLDYETVVGNIERFLSLRRHAGARKPMTVMQMVVSRDNIREVSEYRNRWQAYVDAVVFKPMHNFLTESTSIHGQPASECQLTRCRQPFSTLVVFQSGDLGLCCWDTDHAVDLGNVMDGKLIEMYNGPGFARVRQAMIRKDCLGLKPCDGCSRIYGLDDPVWLDHWMKELEKA